MADGSVLRALLLSARACAAAVPLIPVGIAERKNLLVAQRLLTKTWLDLVILPLVLARAHAALLDLAPSIERLLRMSGAMLLKRLPGASEADLAAIHEHLAEAAGLLAEAEEPEARQLALDCLDIEAGILDAMQAAYDEEMAALPALTQAIAPAPFDLDAMAAFLSGVAGAPVTIESVRRIPGGHSKSTVALGIAAGTSLPPAIVIRSDVVGGFLKTFVSDEYAVIKALYDRGIRVPRPIATEPTGRVSGNAFIVVEAARGKTIGDMFNRPPPSDALNRAIAVEMARLHQVPTSALGSVLPGADLATRDQVAGWLAGSHAAWEALPARSAILDASFAWLAAHLHLAEAPPVVMHGDLGLNNILVDGDEVGALLDWEFVCAGPAAYDMAYFQCMSVWLGDWSDFLRAYADAGGTVPAPEVLDFFILFANVRLATMILQGVAVFEAGTRDEIAWANPGAHDVRLAMQRVANQYRRVTARPEISNPDRDRHDYHELQALQPRVAGHTHARTG